MFRLTSTAITVSPAPEPPERPLVGAMAADGDTLIDARLGLCRRALAPPGSEQKGSRQ